MKRCLREAEGLARWWVERRAPSGAPLSQETQEPYGSGAQSTQIIFAPKDCFLFETWHVIVVPTVTSVILQLLLPLLNRNPNQKPKPMLEPNLNHRKPSVVSSWTNKLLQR